MFKRKPECQHKWVYMGKSYFKGDRCEGASTTLAWKCDKCNKWMTKWFRGYFKWANKE